MLIDVSFKLQNNQQHAMHKIENKNKAEKREIYALLDHEKFFTVVHLSFLNIIVFLYNINSLHSTK